MNGTPCLVFFGQDYNPQSFAIVVGYDDQGHQMEHIASATVHRGTYRYSALTTCCQPALGWSEAGRRRHRMGTRTAYAGVRGWPARINGSVLVCLHRISKMAPMRGAPGGLRVQRLTLFTGRRAAGERVTPWIIENGLVGAMLPCPQLFYNTASSPTVDTHTARPGNAGQGPAHQGVCFFKKMRRAWAISASRSATTSGATWCACWRASGWRVRAHLHNQDFGYRDHVERL